jgi:hypothetical protein
MLKVIFLVEGELSFAFFCPFGYIPHPLDAPIALSSAILQFHNAVFFRSLNSCPQWEHRK